MKWEITGADRIDGNDTKVTIDAESEDSARRRANRAGVLVATIRPLELEDSVVGVSAITPTIAAQVIAPPPLQVVATRPPVPETFVRNYSGEKAHQSGIEQMLREGWRVESTVTSQPRTGCLRIVMLGFIGAFVFRPKNRFLVTFRRGA